MTSTRLVLIRHGHAQVAIEGIVAGEKACLGLSDEGRKQAQALRDRLAATGELAADVLLTSMVPRAIETASIIAPALGGLDAAQECDLCELHPGEAEGLSWADYRERFGFDMRAEPERPMSPGGDSLVSFQARIESIMDTILRDHAGKTIVVVCHGGVISAVTHAFAGSGGLHGQRPFYLNPDNTSITEWHRRPEGRVPPWQLIRYNDTAHLLTW